MSELIDEFPRRKKNQDFAKTDVFSRADINSMIVQYQKRECSLRIINLCGDPDAVVKSVNITL